MGLVPRLHDQFDGMQGAAGRARTRRESLRRHYQRLAADRARRWQTDLVIGPAAADSDGLRRGNYCSPRRGRTDVIVRLPSDGANAGAAFIYSTTCSNSGLVTRFDMR